jgi:hypothetical protein
LRRASAASGRRPIRSNWSPSRTRKNGRFGCSATSSPTARGRAQGPLSFRKLAEKVLEPGLPRIAPHAASHCRMARRSAPSAGRIGFEWASRRRCVHKPSTAPTPRVPCDRVPVLASGGCQIARLQRLRRSGSRSHRKPWRGSPARWPPGRPRPPSRRWPGRCDAEAADFAGRPTRGRAHATADSQEKRWPLP